MQSLSSAGQQAVTDIAQRHGFSVAGVMHMLDAVLRGNGGMAQFSHADFSGSGQWMRGGMTMVSDLFNHQLKGRVDSLCRELSELVASQPGLVQAGSFQSQSQGAPVQALNWGATGGAENNVHNAPNASANLFAPPPPDWWGPSLRHPNSTGSQNGARYAYFAQARRLAVEAGGNVTVYDTGDHQIGGFSQQQDGDGSMSCSSQHGTISLASLPVVLFNGNVALTPSGPSAPVAPRVNCDFGRGDGNWTGSGHGASVAPSRSPAQSDSTGNASPSDVLSILQKLADLYAAGVLTADEFGAKKAALLARL